MNGEYLGWEDKKTFPLLPCKNQTQAKSNHN